MVDIGFCVEIQEDPFLLIGMFDYDNVVIKGDGHAYKLRLRNKNPPPNWRYYYNIPGKGVVHDDHLHEGAKFVHGTDDNRGHYMITKLHEDGTVTIVHDERGKSSEKRVTKEELRDLLHHRGGEIHQAVSEKGKKLLRNYEAALEHGTDYHKRVRKEDLLNHAQRHGDQSILEKIKGIEERAKVREQEKERQAKKTGNPVLDDLEEKAIQGDLTDTEVEKLSTIKKRPLSPKISVALSPDKKKSFHTRHKVVDLFDLVTSHDMNGRLRKDYDQDLQSRHRGSIADTEQIRRMASSLEPMALLYDSRRTDEGSPIVGEDGMVESGNGRTLAMMWAAKGNNNAWKEYKEEIGYYLPSLGLSEKDLEGKRFPVVVRERVTGDGNKDFRVSFAEAANTSSIKRMSSFEEAQMDSGRITPDMISMMKFNPEESVESALSRESNKKIAGEYLDSMPLNESAALMDERGDLSKHGRDRFKAALYLYSLPGKSGETIARTFVESSDHDLKNFDGAFSRSLPSLARVRSMYNTGERDSNLDLMPDLAQAISTLDELKRKDMPVEKYLSQRNLFEGERMTNDFQNKILKKVDEIKRSPKKLRELLTSYVETVENEPDARPEDRPGETQDLLVTTLGEEFAKPKKKGLGSAEAVWDETVKRFNQKQSSTGQGALF